MWIPGIPMLLRPVPGPSVRPFARIPRPAGPRPPEPDPEHPLASEMLGHLEEWGHEGAGDSGDGLSLPPGVLEHLEEWADREGKDLLERPIEPDARAARPEPPAPRTSDRDHPLWDELLDG